MKLNFLRGIAAFVLLSATVAAHSQMPANNDAWKARCNMLNALAPQIERSSAPAVLTEATRGIPSINFAEIGFDRSRASEHYVSCTFFYMAAIAERAGNGGKATSKRAHNLLVVAQSEVALAHSVKPTTVQHVKRGEEEANQVRAPHMNSEQTTAVLSAADTLPVNLPH